MAFVKQLRSWFFQVSGSPGTRLRALDQTTQGTMESLTASCAFLLEDVASTTRAGVVALSQAPQASDQTVIDGVAYPKVCTKSEVLSLIPASTPLQTDQPLFFNASDLPGKVNLKASPNVLENQVIYSNLGTLVYGSPVSISPWAAISIPANPAIYTLQPSGGTLVFRWRAIVYNLKFVQIQIECNGLEVSMNANVTGTLFSIPLFDTGINTLYQPEFTQNWNVGTWGLWRGEESCRLRMSSTGFLSIEKIAASNADPSYAGFQAPAFKSGQIYNFGFNQSYWIKSN